ncbi:MAG: M20 family metallopeptidase [Firmicutes bacterium]|nr:M20 family metallopeptidase [Bacillota bacterium]
MIALQPSDTDLVALLQYFVSIPSVNPGFADPGDDPSHFGEKRYAEALAEELHRIGCQVWLDEVLPDRHNVMARLPGSVGNHSIALQSHLDTVQVAGMTVSPWGKLEGDRLYGRGSSDPKASTVAQLAALRYIQEKDIAADVYFVGTVDEELSFKGALQVAENYKFDACIVGEPTDMAPIIAHKGAVRFELIAEGVSCHSSNPQLGRNAILEMMSLLAAFQKPFTDYTSAQTHPLTGPATWAPTLIEGGSGLNTIPSSCSLAIDRRLVPGETPEQVLSFIDDWVAKQRAKGHPWQKGRVFTIDPPLEPDPTSDVLIALQEALQIIGLNPQPQGVAYGTDASKIALSGTPCIVFGPGSITKAHSADEWVDVSAINPAAKALATTIEILDRKWRHAANGSI